MWAGLCEIRGLRNWQLSGSNCEGGIQTFIFFLIGPEEPHDPIPRKTKEVLEADARVIFTGSMREPEELYTAMDILVLPTYREGFPIVPLEAAAMQLPVVATWVDGCREAVINGITGLLVPPKDTEKLAAALEVLIKARI